MSNLENANETDVLDIQKMKNEIIDEEKKENQKSNEMAIITKKIEKPDENVLNFSKRVAELEKKLNHSYRPIDIYEHHRTLYEAMIFPEFAKGIKFPSCFMSIPTFTYQIKNSFTISTNNVGNCWLEFNMGQYLDESRFKDGVNNKNGTSNIGNSNLFVCNDDTLTGNDPINSVATVCVPNNLMKGKSNIFNAVRPGPTSIRYEYIGRIDIASGNVIMGINYSSQSDSNATTPSNGLLPDVRYSTLSAIEDCPFARSANITDNLKAIFIPHDQSVLNMKPPTDDTSTVTCQRLFMLTTSAPPNQTIARITITQNWEGTPTHEYSDLLSLSYNTFPSEFNGEDIYKYMISHNLIITKDDSEFGLYKFK